MNIFDFVEAGRRGTVRLGNGQLVTGTPFVEGDSVASGARIRDERDGTVYGVNERCTVKESL